MSELQLDTCTIGKQGEFAIISDLLSQNVECWLPANDNKNCDLLAFSNGTYKRIQIKTITKLKTKSSVEVKMHKHIKNVHNIDYLAVYLTEEKLCAYIPYNGEASIMLALKRAKNCQNKKRKWFYEYMDFI